MSNEKKNATLGMSHGTAANRLRKMILFRQLKKHGENVCVRCGKSIEAVEDLSIEHIKPWEGISAELFWDLENIAFSHISCNRPHRYPGPAIPVEEGNVWCCVCQSEKPRSEFHQNSYRNNGLSAECKPCKSKRNSARVR